MFTGTANYPSHILIEWQSVSEIATVLYRIYRATVNNPAQAILISPDISAHPGSTQGYYYSYQDTLNLVGGTTYYYWIQDQDINGVYHHTPGTQSGADRALGVFALRRRVQLRDRHPGFHSHRQPVGTASPAIVATLQRTT